MEFIHTLEFIVKNPETAWIGYTLIIITLSAIALATTSSFLVKLVSSMKELIKELKVNKDSDYVKQIKNETNISPLLNDIKNAVNADRVCVMQYHNGIHSIANNSLLKLSMTHEKLSSNTTSIINQVQNWPANYISAINDKIFNKKCMAMPKIHDMQQMSELRGVYQQLLDFKVKSLYCFPVTDARGKVFGIGAVQFTNEEYNIEEQKMYWVKGVFASVGTLLAGLNLGEESIE